MVKILIDGFEAELTADGWKCQASSVVEDNLNSWYPFGLTNGEYYVPDKYRAVLNAMNDAGVDFQVIEMTRQQFDPNMLY